MTLSVIFYPNRFVRTISSIPVCPIPFCPYTILSYFVIPIFVRYYFVRYHFVLGLLSSLSTSSFQQRHYCRLLLRLLRRRSVSPIRTRPESVLGSEPVWMGLVHFPRTFPPDISP